MKDGVLIVNTVDRENVNEKAMAEAVKSGKVGGYAYYFRNGPRIAD